GRSLDRKLKSPIPALSRCERPPARNSSGLCGCPWLTLGGRSNLNHFGAKPIGHSRAGAPTKTRDVFCTGGSMTPTDSVFRRALSNMLTEIFDGPPGQEAYLLNPGDPGLLRQLDTIEARAASQRPMPGKTTIAAHVDHVHFGLSLLNRWAAGEANPWAGA